jgi:hypothetical protein
MGETRSSLLKHHSSNETTVTNRLQITTEGYKPSVQMRIVAVYVIFGKPPIHILYYFLTAWPVQYVAHPCLPSMCGALCNSLISRVLQFYKAYAWFHATNPLVLEQCSRTAHLDDATLFSINAYAQNIPLWSMKICTTVFSILRHGSCIICLSSWYLSTWAHDPS